MKVADAFELQAKYCAAMGSQFTALVLRQAINRLTENTAVGARVLNWPGDPSTVGDAVALRLAGGLHALVLSGRSAELRAIYPPHETPEPEKLGEVIEAAINTHAKFLLHWLDSAPQTNESGRMAPLIAAAHMLAERFELPFDLLELGCSAGLNLNWDRVAVKTDQGILGNATADLILTPDWKGIFPTATPFEIASRAGVDLNPLDPSDDHDRLRMLSYIWPDQPQRLERMAKAIEVTCANPSLIRKMDAIEWLKDKLTARNTNRLTIIFHTVAWQYFPQDAQISGQNLIEKHGAKATDENPLAWLSMENDGSGKGALLSLRLWPGNRHITLGRADFHGRWLRWDQTDISLA